MARIRNCRRSPTDGAIRVNAPPVELHSPGISPSESARAAQGRRLCRNPSRRQRGSSSRSLTRTSAGTTRQELRSPWASAARSSTAGTWESLLNPSKFSAALPMGQFSLGAHTAGEFTGAHRAIPSIPVAVTAARFAACQDRLLPRRDSGWLGA